GPQFEYRPYFKNPNFLGSLLRCLIKRRTPRTVIGFASSFARSEFIKSVSDQKRLTDSTPPAKPSFEQIG
ncbi:MAG: hypothetical protein ACTHMB_25570, partial [Candidatus Binatia bacterium]